MDWSTTLITYEHMEVIRKINRFDSEKTIIIRHFQRKERNCTNIMIRVITLVCIYKIHTKIDTKTQRNSKMLHGK